MLFRISEGLDIPVEGPPEQAVSGRANVSTAALLGSDYVGLSRSATRGSVNNLEQLYPAVGWLKAIPSGRMLF